MKRYLVFTCVYLLWFESPGQEIKKDADRIETKMDAFVSKRGAMLKFEDFSLPPLKLYMGQTAATRVRKVSSGSEAGFFFQIEKQGQYDSKVASIEYSDLIDLLAAISVLKEHNVEDVARNPDYLENKFVTADGFQIGYYVNDGKSKWYLTLERYGSDNSIFINDVSTIETVFLNGKAKIEELKQ